jgi:hypothetical protein
MDDLPGKGKPIRWEDEALTPEDQRLAHRVIKNGGFTLGWIEERQEIEALYAELRAGLLRARAARAAGSLDEAGWQDAREQFSSQVRALNRRILGYNMRVPNEQFHRLPYPPDPDGVA